MTTLLTPGVYLRQIEVAPPSAARMSVTGFVGQAERGPLDSPQQLNSWGQYRDIFGDFVGYAYLPYSVFGFFLNGGERCYVVRVAHESAGTARTYFAGEPLTQLDAPVEEGIGQAFVKSAAGINVGDELLLDDGSASALVRVRERPTGGLKPVFVFDMLEKGPDGGPAAVPFIEEGGDVRSLSVNVFAASPGAWGDSLTVSTGDASDPAPDLFRMVFRLRRAGRIVREEVFDNLSASPASDRYFVSVINGEPEEPDYLRRLRRSNSILARVEDLCARRRQVCPRPENVSERPLSGGSEDTRLVTAAHLTGYRDGEPRPPSASGGAGKYYGLAAFELVSEVGLVAIPDLVVPDFYKGLAPAQVSREGIIFSRGLARVSSFAGLEQGQRDMLLHCQRMGDRFALFDSPRGAQTGRGANKIEDWPARFNQLAESKNAALYYPWLREKADDFSGRNLFLPPSGHVAGVCARAERVGGVGRAPANELLDGVVEFEFCLTDDEQATLNPRGVNCLRSLPGRGQRVWGARTLSRDPAWRYVNVRRLTLFVIRQILVNLQWTIFEPNDRGLWNRITATLTLFLNDMHKAGALAGDTAEQSFFVKCDDETNPPEAIDAGQVVTLIGFAPARPAEFVLVTVRRTAESVSVKER